MPNTMTKVNRNFDNFMAIQDITGLPFVCPEGDVADDQRRWEVTPILINLQSNWGQDTVDYICKKMCECRDLIEDGHCIVTGFTVGPDGRVVFCCDIGDIN